MDTSATGLLDLAVRRHTDASGEVEYEAFWREILSTLDSAPDLAYHFAVLALEDFFPGSARAQWGQMKLLRALMPASRWPELTRLAASSMIPGQVRDDLEEVLEDASLQQPSSLAPIYQLVPIGVEMAYSIYWLSDPANTQALASLFRRHDTSPGSVDTEVALAELAVPSPSLSPPDRIQEALEAFQGAGSLAAAARPDSRVNKIVTNLGFRLLPSGVLLRLYPAVCRHLAFPADYPVVAKHAITAGHRHPTWVEPAPGELYYRFGGQGSGQCHTCGGSLHHLVTLAPVPDGLGITGLDRLELSVCLTCLGWETEDALLRCRHDPDGGPHDLTPMADTLIHPQFPATDLLPTTVCLRDMGERWRLQRALSGENLHRLGGHPTWVQCHQYPVFAYPPCALCGNDSAFLLQLDTGLPTSDGSAWHWGSGGMGYAFWCDQCKVSTYLWQCT
jgi:hypothetical protein